MNKKALNLFAFFVFALLLSCSNETEIPFSNGGDDPSSVETEASYHIYARDANTGEPLDSAVKITLLSTGETLSASELGVAVVELQAGSHQLRIEREGYAAKIVELVIGVTVDGSVYIAKENSLLVSLYPLTAGLNGYLFYEDANGKSLPLAGAAIRIVLNDEDGFVKKTYETETDKDGYYSFDSLPAVDGYYELWALTKGYEAMQLPNARLIGGLVSSNGTAKFDPSKDQSLFMVLDYKKVFDYEENGEPLVIKFSDQINLGSVNNSTVAVSQEEVNIEWGADSLTLTIKPADKWATGDFTVSFTGLKSVKGNSLEGGNSLTITVKGKDIRGEKVEGFAALDSMSVKYTSKTVDLKWEKVEGAAGYNIYAKEKGFDNDYYEKADCSPQTDTTAVCYFNTAQTALSDKKYIFAIEAFNSDFRTSLDDAPEAEVCDRSTPGFADGSSQIWDGCYNFEAGACAALSDSFTMAYPGATGSIYFYDTTAYFYDYQKDTAGTISRRASITPSFFSSRYLLPTLLVSSAAKDEIAYGKVFFDMPMDTSAELSIVCAPEKETVNPCDKLQLELSWQGINNAGMSKYSQVLAIKVFTKEGNVVDSGFVNAVYSISGLKGFNDSLFTAKYPAAEESKHTVNIRFIAEASTEKVMCGDYSNYINNYEQCKAFSFCELLSSQNPNPFSGAHGYDVFETCKDEELESYCGGNVFNYNSNEQCRRYSFCKLHPDNNPFDFRSDTTCADTELKSYCGKNVNDYNSNAQCLSYNFCELHPSDNPFNYDNDTTCADAELKSYCGAGASYYEYYEHCRSYNFCEQYPSDNPFDYEYFSFYGFSSTENCEPEQLKEWCGKNASYATKPECGGYDYCELYSADEPNPFAYSCREEFKKEWCELSADNYKAERSTCAQLSVPLCVLFPDASPFDYECDDSYKGSWCAASNYLFTDGNCVSYRNTHCSESENMFSDVQCDDYAYAYNWCRASVANYALHSDECSGYVSNVCADVANGREANPFTYSCADSYKDSWCAASNYLFTDDNCLDPYRDQYCDASNNMFSDANCSSYKEEFCDSNPPDARCSVPPSSSSSEEGDSSSSEAEPSSSSIAPSSSSDAIGGLCDGFTDGTEREHYGANKPQFCDERDGSKYVYATIGSQTWMAENLNYEAAGSKCYGDDEANCELYGRLYNWATAMDISSDYNSSSYPSSGNHRGICPAGWHLPSYAEWDALASAIASEQSCSNCDAKHLKATEGWTSYSGIENLDTYGFAALPGGSGSSDGDFSSAGD